MFNANEIISSVLKLSHFFVNKHNNQFHFYDQSDSLVPVHFVKSIRIALTDFYKSKTPIKQTITTPAPLARPEKKPISIFMIGPTEPTAE